MACCRSCLSHRDFAACPRSSLLHRTARPRIHRLDRLEERQDVLSAFGRPFSEKPMMRVVQRASATDGDESRVALLGKDHRSLPSAEPATSIVTIGRYRLALRIAGFLPPALGLASLGLPGADGSLSQ